MVALPKNTVAVAGVCSHDAGSIFVGGESLYAVVLDALALNANSLLIVTNDATVVDALSESLYAVVLLTDSLYSGSYL
jgi:hypothetical protein